MVRAVTVHFKITIPAFTCNSKEAHNKCMNSGETSQPNTVEYQYNEILGTSEINLL